MKWRTLRAYGGGGCHVDSDNLLQWRGHALRHNPGRDIGPSAGREWYDQADRLLRPRPLRCGRRHVCCHEAEERQGREETLASLQELGSAGSPSIAMRRSCAIPGSIYFSVWYFEKSKDHLKSTNCCCGAKGSGQVSAQIIGGRHRHRAAGQALEAGCRPKSGRRPPGQFMRPNPRRTPLRSHP